MKVTLISHTENPIETLNAVWDASRHDDSVMFNNCSNHLFCRVIESGIPVAEMIDFVFLIEGVSISLREQMVRHRIGVKVGDRIGADIAPDLCDSSWWSQSMRILDMGEFASKGNFVVPESIEKDPACKAIYGTAMEEAGIAYRQMVERGVPLEDARNVIPLAATHRIVWKLNLAALMHIVGKRGCWILQLGLWRPLIEGMVNKLAKEVDPIFRDLIKPPCLEGHCLWNGCKFKLDNQRRIDGEDEIPPCPLYLRHHRADADSVLADYEKEGGCDPAWRPTAEGWDSDDPAKRCRMNQMREDYCRLWGRDVDTGEKL